MKRLLLVMAILLSFSGLANATGFTNGGFENGNTGGWTGGGGAWSNPNIWPLDPDSYAGGTQNNTIVGTGFDPNTGNNLKTVYSGAYSLRANDSINNYSVSTIKQTVTNYTDPNIFFAWAAVLEASHGPTDSDNFTLKLRNESQGLDLITRSYNSYNNGSIFFNYYGGYRDWYYTLWQIESLDVSQYYGDTFSLTLLASDCPYGGHAGYVYLDGFGAIIPPQLPSGVPEPGTCLLVAVGGLALAGLKIRNRKKRAC